MVVSIQDFNSIDKLQLSKRVNQLLNLLPNSDYQSLTTDCQTVTIASKSIIHQPNEPIEAVYFPIGGIVSLIYTTEDGYNAEIATISNDGIVGISAFLGGQFLYSYAVAQTDCVALRIPTLVLQREFDRGGVLQKILLLYTQALFTQVSQNTICRSKHTIEQRLARLLLSYSDRLGQDVLLLTQEDIADLMSVRRPSVSVVAHNFLENGIISYTRGKITIFNRKALARLACECEEEIHREYCRLLNGSI